MSVEAIIEMIHQYLPESVQVVLMMLGGLVCLGYAYVKASPKKEDDQWLQKIEAMPIVGLLLRVLVALSPVDRKEVKENKEVK